MSSPQPVTPRNTRRLAMPRGLKRAAAAVALILIALFAASFGYLSFVAPPQRADAMARTVAVPARDFQKRLDAVSAAVARQQTLYNQVPSGVPNALAQQIRLNAQDGMDAASGALSASGQIHFSVNTFGQSVGVAWVPSLAGGDGVRMARQDLVRYPRQAVEMEGHLRDAAALFAYSRGMALVMRDFLTYDPSRDLGLPIQAGDRQTALLRLDRTLGALADSLDQLSAVNTPPSLLADQERVAREFVVAGTLLSQIERDVQNENLAGANERGPAYIATIKTVQADLQSLAALAQDQLKLAEKGARDKNVVAPLVAYLDAHP